MWADNETELDLLGFEYLVDGLVVALTQPRLLPLTIGVLGDWGSGTSELDAHHCKGDSPRTSCGCLKRQ